MTVTDADDGRIIEYRDESGTFSNVAWISHGYSYLGSLPGTGVSPSVER